MHKKKKKKKKKKKHADARADAEADIEIWTSSETTKKQNTKHRDTEIICGLTLRPFLLV
jgi:hypothetical protein